MSGVDAAATLTLKIDTSSAAADLATLKKEYQELRSALNAQTNDKGLTGVGTEASIASRKIETLTATIATMQAKLTSVGTTGSSTGVFSNITKAGYEAQGLLGQLDHSVERSGHNLNILLRNAEITGNASIKAGEERLKNLNKLNAAQAEVYSELLRGDEQRARAQAKLQELNASGTNAAARAAELRESKQITQQMEAQAALRELNVTGTQAAARAAALALEKQITKQLEEQARWLALTDKQRASATVQAAKAVYGNAQQNLLPGVAGSSQALLAAQNAGSVSAAEAELVRLTNAHKTLSPAIMGSAEHQVHWNSVAHEGQSAARGLAGVLGGLWVTYGSMVPLLAGAALAGGFVQAAKTGAEFAYQLTFVKALGGESAEAVQKLSDAALNLSKNGLQGPVEISSGFRILAQAGLSAAQALESVPHVLHLATVGEMTMEQSAITLVGVMNAFNLSVKDSEHIGDVFAKAAAVSQTSVQEMTQALKTASVVGEQYGVSMEDAATAVTLLAKVNIVGTAAGTSVRNMMKELYAPTKAAAETMKTLGLETKDTAGNVKPFADIIYDLRGKLEGFNKASQIKLEQALFGERGSKEVVQMLSQTREEWDKLQSSIDNSDGFLKSVSSQLEDTVKGQWLEAVNTLKAGLIQAYQEMAPIFLNLAQSIKQLFSDEDFTSKLKSIVSGVAQFSQFLVEHAAVIVGVTEAYLTLKAATLAYSLAITTLGAVVKATAMFTSLSVAITGASTALPLFTQSLAAVATGAATTVTGLTGVAGAATLLAPPIAAISALLVVGVGIWLMYENQAAKTLANLRSDAERSVQSISRLNEAIGDVRLGKVTGDTGIRGALDGYKELNKEVEDFESKVKQHFGNKTLEFDTEYRVKRRDVGNTYTYAGGPEELEKGRLALIEKRAKLDELARVSAENRASGEEKLNTAMKTGKGVWDANIKPTKATKATKVHDYQGDLEKSDIAFLIKQEKENIKVLDLVHKNGLISEEQYQSQLAGIYAVWSPKIEAEYSSSLSRLKALQDAATGNEKLQYKKKYTDLASAHEEFLFNEEYRSAESIMREQGQIKKATEDFIKTVLEQEAATQQVKDRLSATRLKLDMTPEQAAGYDARKASEKTLDKPVANAEARVINLRNAGYEEESTAMVAAMKLMEDMIETRRRLGDEAAAQAESEIGYARSYEFGWKQAFRTWADEGMNAAKSAADSFQIMTNSMESFLDNFLTTGKLGFEDFAKSVILSIAKIEARALLASTSKGLGGEGGEGFGGIIKGILGILGLGGSSGVTGGTIPGVMTNGIASMIGTSSAKGNVFSGSPSLHAYANTVQTTPQSFSFQNLHGFAKGGVFAEVGPEAVMPLARDSSGRLGIRVANGGDANGGNVFNVNVNISGNSTASDVHRAGGQVAREIASAIRSTLQFA